MIAYSYLRISTPEQRKGRGPMRQLDDTSRYCRKHGLNLDPKTLEDLGLSGYHGKHISHGALGGFLEGIATKAIPTPCALVIEALDRLTRQQCEEAVFLLLSLVRAGVEVHTVADETVYRSGEIPMHQLMYSVMVLSTGHQESDRKSGMLKKSWHYKRKEARESGKPMTRILPEWLTIEDGKIVPIPERALIVQRIFRESADGSGKLTIAGRFIEEGIETWGRGGKKGTRWHYSYIHKILTNRAVLGEYQPHRMVAGKRTPDEDPLIDFFPAVITPEEWTAASESLRSRSTRYDANPEAPRNLVPGLVHIEGNRATWMNKGRRSTSDGARKTKKPHPHGGYWVYYRTLDPKTGKTLHLIPALEIEDMILAALRKADGEEWMQLINKAAPPVDAAAVKRAQLEAKVKKTKESLERLVNALAIGIGGAKTITAKIATEEETLQKAKDDLAKLGPEDIQPAVFAKEIDELRQLAETGDTSHPDIRKTISKRITSLFSRIDIGRTPSAMMAEKRKSDAMTPFVLTPGLLDRQAAASMEDPKFFWALLTPRFSAGVRLMVMSHAFTPAALALFNARAEYRSSAKRGGRPTLSRGSGDPPARKPATRGAF